VSEKEKFESFLKAVGRDFKKALPWVKTVGEAAVSAFFPGMSALFNQTVNAVVTAQQNGEVIALGGGTLTDEQKVAAVVQLMGPLIAQALTDAGRASDAADVENYIKAVIQILDTTPAPTLSAATS